MKKQATKKILALLLTFIMLVGIVPFSVFAESDDDILLTTDELNNEEQDENLNFFTQSFSSDENENEGTSEFDGMIPFKAADSSYDPYIAYYVATVGEYFIPIDKAMGLTSEMGGPNETWIEITFEPKDGSSSFTRDFYIGNAWATPQGGLLLGDTPAGKYDLYYESNYMGILEVLSPGESTVIGLGGTYPYYGRPNTENVALGNWWIESLFEYGSNPYFGEHFESSFSVFRNGSVYLAVAAANIKVSDITELKRGETSLSFTVLPGGALGSTLRRYFLRIDDNITEWNTNEEFSVKVKDDTYTAELYLNEYDSDYYLDITKIDQLELTVLPGNGLKKYEKITVKIIDDYNENLILEQEISFADGGYKLKIPQNLYLFEESSYLIIELYLDGYSIASTYLSQFDILEMYLPINDSGTVYESIISSMDVLANIDGQRFELSQYFYYDNPLYKSNINFSLVDAAFNPVSGVTIGKEKILGDGDPWEYLQERSYIFNATSNLTVDATYYLRFGAFPLVKLTAKNSLGDVGGGTINEPTNQIWGNSSYIQGDNFGFTVSMLNGTINANEWSVKLIKQAPGATKQTYTYSISDGTLGGLVDGTGTGYANFYATTSLSAGIYMVEYYRGSEKIEPLYDEAGYNDFSYINPSIVIVSPMKKGVDYLGMSYSYYWDAVDGVYKISIRNFYVSGYTTPNASVTDMTATFYKTTLEAFAYDSPKTVSIPTFTASESGHFITEIPTSELKTAGIDAGFYYVVITYNQGVVQYTDMVTITDAWLASGETVNTVNLSGTVTLLGNNVNDVVVELWNGEIKFAETKIIAGTFSFPNLPQNLTYTIKIPAGKNWAAFEQSYTMTADRSVQIELTSIVASYTVKGKVTANGAPVSGYVVGIYDKENQTNAVATAATDAQGNYTLTVAEGIYIIKGAATADYKAYTGTEFEVSDSDITGKNITLAAKPGIEGVVTLESTPMANVYVYLYTESGSYIKSTVTDIDGKYQFKDLAENTTYKLSASSDDYEAEITAVTTADGKTTANIALNPLVTLSGKVTFNGTPISGVYVKLSKGGSASDGSLGAESSYRTDGEGNYSFTRIKADGTTEYTLSVSKGRDYSAFTKKLTLSENTTENIALAPLTTYGVTFNITGQDDDTAFDLYVYDNYGTTQMPSDKIMQLPEGSYKYYYYYGDIYGTGDFDVAGDMTVDLTLPEIYTISGIVKNIDDEVVSGAEVQLSGAAGYKFTTTNADGVYNFKVLGGSGTVTLSVRHSSEGYGKASDYFDNADLAIDDIVLQTNSVTISVKNEQNTPVPGAYVYIGGMSGYTNLDGEFIVRNIEDGAMYLYVDCYGYLGYYDTIAVDAADDTEVDVVLKADPNLQYIFALGISNDEITSSGYVTVTPVLTYTGSGTPESGGTVTVNIPAGLKVYGDNPYSGNDYTVNFAADKTVTLPSLTIMVDGNIGNLTEFNLYANYETDDVYKSSWANITVVNSTLTVPGVVKAGESFKVYGTAPSGSVVAIKDQNGNTLKTVTVANRYFNTTISIAATGEYTLRAVAVKDDQTDESPAVAVMVMADVPPSITNIDITEGYLSGKPAVNNLYGFPTFSTWVLMRSYAPYIGQYRGIYNIAGSFKVNNLGDFEVKNVTFTDGTAIPTAVGADGTYSFLFPIDTWGGVGVAPIVVTLTKDGVDYQFTIALVTILIDPSGYIYDSLTGERIDGATVTLETKSAGNWILWNDPDGLQMNPQYTGETGDYGWMVPMGEYRVIAEADGYETQIANKFDGSYQDDENASIPVPPEQTEVNIALKYISSPDVSSEWKNDKVVLTFSRPMETADVMSNLTISVGASVINGTWEVSGSDRVFTFTPATNFAGGATIKISIAPSVISKDGIPVGEVTIDDVNVPEDEKQPPVEPGPDGPNEGDGGGGGSTDVIITPEKAEFDKNGGKSIIVTITSSSTLKDVKNGDYTLIKDKDYTDDNGIIVIKAEYLASLSNGEQVIVFEMNNGKTVKITITVKDTAEEEKEEEPPVEEEPWVNPFTDVDENEWYYEFVKAVNIRGLFRGTSETTFEPALSMTRAMFTQVLANLEGVDLSAYTTSRFTDVAENAWYAAPVEWAASIGVVQGYGDGIFGPNDKITREQMAVMLNNYVKYKGIALPEAETEAFADEDNISDWAYESVKAIQAAGIIIGRPDNSFDPSATATRAEVATIFARFLNIIDNIADETETEAETETETEAEPTEE